MQTNGKYYFYGSQNSLDVDVIFEVDEFDENIENVYSFCREIKKEYPFNINLAVFKNGNIVDVIKRKSLIDGLNNSLYFTYENHKQVFDKPILTLLPRNKELNHYKCLRTILSMLTRTNLRSQIKAVLNAWQPFQGKINILDSIDFTTITSFNQKYEKDIDIWKGIAFYLGQAISLEQNIEIYEKNKLIELHPTLSNFVLRKEFSKENLVDLQSKWKEFVQILKSWNFSNPKESILIVNGNTLDLLNEIVLS